MFEAAIPVLAVTEMTEVFLEYFRRRAVMIARKSKDLPEPRSPTPVNHLLRVREPQAGACASDIYALRMEGI